MTIYVVALGEGGRGGRRPETVVLIDAGSRVAYQLDAPERDPIRLPAAAIGGGTDDAFVRAACELVAATSNRLTVQFEDRQEHDDLVAALNAADSLLAPSGEVPRDDLSPRESAHLGDAIAALRSVMEIAHLVPDARLNEIPGLAREMQRQAARARDSVSGLARRTLRARDSASVAAALSHVHPHQHLDGFPLHADSLKALHARGVFTLQELRDYAELDDLRRELRKPDQAILDRALDAVDMGRTDSGDSSAFEAADTGDDASQADDADRSSAERGDEDTPWGELSPRVVALLEQNGYTSLQAVSEGGRGDVRAIAGIGKQSMEEIDRELGNQGLTLKPRRRAPAAQVSERMPETVSAESREPITGRITTLNENSYAYITLNRGGVAKMRPQDVHELAAQIRRSDPGFQRSDLEGVRVSVGRLEDVGDKFPHAVGITLVGIDRRNGDREAQVGRRGRAVPSVVGRNLDEAFAAIQRQGYKNIEIDADGATPIRWKNWRVTSMNVKPGSRFLRTATIVLAVERR